MTELRPLLAIVGLVVVAVAIGIGIARMRGWRVEWWERFLSPGRARGPGAASSEGPGAARGARAGSARPASKRASRPPGAAGSRRPATDQRGKQAGRQALIDLEDLPVFNPRERPRAATLDREFDVGDLGAIESESQDPMRPPTPAPSAPSRGSGPSRAPPRGTDARPVRERAPGPEARRGAAREEPRSTADAAPDPAGDGQELLVVLTILTSDERDLAGPLIRDALASFDLQPDDLGIFHHYGNRASRRGTHREPVFSVANVLDPGVFDVDSMDELATPGLCLFLRRPGPLPASVAFDLMVDVGTRLARALEATLCDDQRCRLTVQATQALRERVVHFALRNERGLPDAR